MHCEAVDEFNATLARALDCTLQRDPIIPKICVDTETVTCVVVHIVTYYVSSVALVRIVSCGVVRYLGLEEVGFAVVSVPFNDSAERVLTEQPVSLYVVSIHYEA